MDKATTRRFFAKVDRRTDPDGCWLWTASTSGGGYGQFRLESRMRPAHRVAYEHIVGPIPDGLELDHLCRVRHCVRPSHLEPVTRRENILRGVAPAARRAQQTHCKRSHPLSGDNLYVTPDEGTRKCKRCRCQTQRRRYYRLQGREMPT